MIVGWGVKGCRKLFNGHLQKRFTIFTLLPCAFFDKLEFRQGLVYCRECLNLLQTGHNNKDLS